MYERDDESTLAALIARQRHRFVPMLEPRLTVVNSIPIDLSATSPEFAGLRGTDWDRAIEAKIESAGVIAAVGGYLEQRAVYADTPNFTGEADRDVHIGVDVFMPAGTPVHSPLAGEIYCFADRRVAGDYGPVILLRHELGGMVFHSLYGHLSVASLRGLRRGTAVEAGERIAEIGARPRNGDWPPHLHFQLIRDLQGLGDGYPGVVRAAELDYYRINCPDPGALVVEPPVS